MPRIELDEDGKSKKVVYDGIEEHIRKYTPRDCDYSNELSPEIISLLEKCIADMMDPVVADFVDDHINGLTLGEFEWTRESAKKFMEDLEKKKLKSKSEDLEKKKLKSKSEDLEKKKLESKSDDWKTINKGRKKHK